MGPVCEGGHAALALGALCWSFPYKGGEGGWTNTTVAISGSGHIMTLPLQRFPSLLNSFSGRRC